MTTTFSLILAERVHQTSKNIDHQLQPIGHLADLVEASNNWDWNPMITIHLCQQVLVTVQILSIITNTQWQLSKDSMHIQGGPI